MRKERDIYLCTTSLFRWQEGARPSALNLGNGYASKRLRCGVPRVRTKSCVEETRNPACVCHITRAACLEAIQALRLYCCNHCLLKALLLDRLGGTYFPATTARRRALVTHSFFQGGVPKPARLARDILGPAAPLRRCGATRIPRTAPTAELS